MCNLSFKKSIRKLLGSEEGSVWGKCKPKSNFPHGVYSVSACHSACGLRASGEVTPCREQCTVPCEATRYEVHQSVATVPSIGQQYDVSGLEYLRARIKNVLLDDETGWPREQMLNDNQTEIPPYIWRYLTNYSGIENDTLASLRRGGAPPDILAT